MSLGTTTKRPLQVPDKIEGALNQTEKLNAVIEDLENRLSGILRVEVEITEGEPDKDAEDLVPVADKIRTISNRIYYAGIRLRDIIERLEI